VYTPPATQPATKVAEAPTEPAPKKTTERWAAHIEHPEYCKVCRACIRACTVGALALVATPKEWMHIDPDLCTGCGDCVEACPQQIFSLRPAEPEP
jgi:ferredoxin